MTRKTAYDEKFYKAQAEGSLRSAKIVLPLVFDIVRPASVVDVGCGVGPWLRAASELGIQDYLGVDGSYVNTSQLMIPADRFRPTDLAAPFDLGRKFDLAMSLEVAEHLPEKSASGFVASLVKLSDVILFSAAIPFQGGTMHINEQWPEYWARFFGEHGYHFFDVVRSQIWQRAEIPWWYSQNIFLVCNEPYLRAKGWTVPDRPPMGFAHPELWVGRNLDTPSTLGLFKKAVKSALGMK